MKRAAPQRSSKSNPKRKWSGEVMQRSHALDLEPGVFTKTDPRQIAISLKRSAMRSRRKKGTPYQSAMSMLNFHINRCGKGLPAAQKQILERAKDELRALFGKVSTRHASLRTRAGTRKAVRHRSP